jgi:hypothetical protein
VQPDVVEKFHGLQTMKYFDGAPIIAVTNPSDEDHGDQD